eukprot:CAMPEP_0114499844 /NCGR_PEP_ID=MMETSP0109-20121206/7639_1 /TAXON_ID=29199 /ORGANISM="Chlorarachnion reptans, Strain CCCM449" /LENGTH=524 /DNA_ID=CAMNT_0001677449 /DNA_START=175 /DNA_END=1749 /DNA_ORIENTATION=+
MAKQNDGTPIAVVLASLVATLFLTTSSDRNLLRRPSAPARVRSNSLPVGRGFGRTGTVVSFHRPARFANPSRCKGLTVRNKQEVDTISAPPDTPTLSATSSSLTSSSLGKSALDSLTNFLGPDPEEESAIVGPENAVNGEAQKGGNTLDSLNGLLPRPPAAQPTPQPFKQKQDAFSGLIIPGNIAKEAQECKTVTDVAAAIGRYIEKDDTKSALRLAAQCREKKGGPLKNFASRHIVVPKKDYALDELERQKINTTAFIAPVDDTLDDIRLGGSIAALSGIFALGYAFHWGIGQGIFCLAGIFALSAYDVVNNNAGGSLLLVDTIGRTIYPSYRRRVAIHEAGHLMVSYLMGVLPVEYTLSALDSYKKRGEVRGLKAAVQAGTRFADEMFKKEIASGSIRTRSLDQFTCISLAGIAAELVILDKAEGGRSDLVQLDGLLFALRFSPQRAAFQVRWAVYNTVSLLRQHKDVVEELADAMEDGKTIPELIKFLEDRIPPPPAEEFNELGMVSNKPLYEEEPQQASY